MRTVSTALQAHLSQPYQTMCSCWLVTLTNGTVLGFTDHDQNIVISGWTGGNAMFNGTYQSIDGYNSSANTSSAQMDVDQIEVSGPQVTPAIVEADIYAGKWDYAQITLFQVNWNDLSNTTGCIRLRDGWLGQVSTGRNDFKAELRGMMQAFTRTIGRLVTPACDANLGDARCGVQLYPPTWQPNTVYVATVATDPTVGSYVSPSAFDNRIFACTTAGTSGATEPSWNTTLGGTTADGTAVWTAQQSLTVQGTLTGANPDNMTLYDSSRAEPGPAGGVAIVSITNANPGVVTMHTGSGVNFYNGEVVTISGCFGMTLVNVVTVIRGLSGDSFNLGIDTSNTSVYPPYAGNGTLTPIGATSGYFDNGVITFTSGNNNGLQMEVRSYVPGQLTLFQPMPYLCQVGDTYSLHAGCDKTNNTCKTRFNNIVNFRGFPFLGGQDQLAQVGRSH